jgi:hypothetical protein
MATATINAVYCIQASTGLFVPSNFFSSLQNVGDRLLPGSVSEVVDVVASVLGDSLSAISGADDLYIRVDGAKIWPTNGESTEINSGGVLQIFSSMNFSGQSVVTLHELDGDSVDPTSGEDDDDSLGSFLMVENEDIGQGQIAKLVKSESEGSAYYVFYEVN